MDVIDAYSARYTKIKDDRKLILEKARYTLDLVREITRNILDSYTS